MANVGTFQLVVDSDIVIGFLQRKSNLLRRAIAHYDCGMTAVTYYELLVVPSLSTQQQTALNNILTSITILPLDGLAAAEAAQIWRDLQTKGQLIGLPDTLIAGICRAQNLPILTLNKKHYQRVENLTLVDETQIPVI